MSKLNLFVFLNNFKIVYKIKQLIWGHFTCRTQKSGKGRQWVTKTSNLGVLLSYQLGGWPQNYVKVQNPSCGAVCQGRSGLECHICLRKKKKKERWGLSIFGTVYYPDREFALKFAILHSFSLVPSSSKKSSLMQWNQNGLSGTPNIISVSMSYVTLWTGVKMSVK